MQPDLLSTEVTRFVKQRLSPNKHRVFLFGSALQKPHFRDVDIGIIGDIDPNQLALLKEDFEESNFPYTVDIVDFNQVAPDFKKKILQDKVLWLNF